MILTRILITLMMKMALTALILALMIIQILTIMMIRHTMRLTERLRGGKRKQSQGEGLLQVPFFIPCLVAKNSKL